MKVKIVNKSKHDLPHYATNQSAGMDLRANLEDPIVLKTLERTLVKTGLFGPPVAVSLLLSYSRHATQNHKLYL